MSGLFYVGMVLLGCACRKIYWLGKCCVAITLFFSEADVADLVMLSKLFGMLASGRPVLATAHPGTQLAKVVSSCGKVVEPGNTQEVVQGLLELLHSPQVRAALGSAARQAAQAWDKEKVLSGFEIQLQELCNE